MNMCVCFDLRASGGSSSIRLFLSPPIFFACRSCLFFSLSLSVFIFIMRCGNRMVKNYFQIKSALNHIEHRFIIKVSISFCGRFFSLSSFNMPLVRTQSNQRDREREKKSSSLSWFSFVIIWFSFNCTHWMAFFGFAYVIFHAGCLLQWVCFFFLRTCQYTFLRTFTAFCSEDFFYCSYAFLFNSLVHSCFFSLSHSRCS